MGLGGRARKWSLGDPAAAAEVPRGGVQGSVFVVEEHRGLAHYPIGVPEEPQGFAHGTPCTPEDSQRVVHGTVDVSEESQEVSHGTPCVPEEPRGVAHGTLRVTEDSQEGAQGSLGVAAEALPSTDGKKAEQHTPGVYPQQRPQEGEMPSPKPSQATRHEVQPLIKGAGALVVVEAASKPGDVSAPKYRSVSPGADERQSSSLLSPFVRQLLAASGPVMATVSSGMTSGFSAVLLPQLAAGGSAFPVSEEEASWIASTAALPMAPGCLLGGLLMEKIGRRLTILLLCVPFFLGWALQSAAPDVLSLCLGRALTGLAVGLLGAPGMVYIGETASPEHRGFLLAAVSLAVSVGVALSHLIGALLPWRTAAGVASIVPLLAFVLTFISPESPLWLASRGKIKEAADVFRMLRGSGPEAEKELDALVARGGPKEELRLEEVVPGAGEKVERPPEPSKCDRWLKQWGLLLRRPSFAKPFFIMNIFFFVQQWCGVNAVTFYTVDIFKATANGNSGATVDEYTATGLVDVARIVASVVACVLLRKCGRRPLAMASGLGSAVSLLALAGFLMAGQSSGDPVARNASLSADYLGDALNATASWEELAEEAVDAAAYAWAWAPVICLILYVLASSVGLIPLPWVMTGEVFPVEGRGLGSGVTSCVGFLAFFSVVKTAPALFRGLGMGGAFCVYGALVLVGTVILYWCLPETKGKTLQEIEDGFGKKKGRAGTGAGSGA